MSQSRQSNTKGFRNGKYRLVWKAGDFPGGPVVKNPPSNAGGTGSIPDQGTKIPHVVRCIQKIKKCGKENNLQEKCSIQ